MAAPESKEKGRAFAGKARPWFTSAGSRGAGADRDDQPPAQAPQAGSAAQPGSAPQPAVAAQPGSAPQPAVAAQLGSVLQLLQLLALALARRLNRPRRARR